MGGLPRHQLDLYFICSQPLKKEMQNLFLLTTILVIFLLISNIDNVQAGKKKKKIKSKKTKMTPEEVLKQDQGLFDSKNVIDEFEAAIYKVDPKKMVDTGTFRLNENGEQKRQVVPYARSQMHLLDPSEKICDNFEDYAQAKFKSTGKPTVIRLTTPEGNMNPDFPKVEVVPDDDLNTKLKFHCENIVEDMDEHLVTLLT